MDTEEEQEKLARLLREAEQAKHGKYKDKYNLRPVAKGYLRGQAFDIRSTEYPSKLGIVKILEFELRENPKEKGVPVRMEGTYFNSRLIEHTVVDVPDPDPSVRPIRTDIIYFSHHGRKMGVQAYNPGRDPEPRRVSLIRGLVVLILPIIATIVAIAALWRIGVLN